MSASCLVTKLSHYIHLTDGERHFLEDFELETTRHERRATVARSGDRLNDIYVLKTGWLTAHTSDAAGTEMIAEIYHPGDIVGTSQLGCEVSTLTYTAATDIQLCPLPKNSFPVMFIDFPRLTALFFAFVAIERATLIDRLRAMGRMSARDCVALFLLQTHARLRLTGSVDAATSRFSMPLSQELIGNAVGLSTVSVNRAIRLLESQGHLERDGRVMQLPQEAALAREIDFVDRVYRIDSSWFPVRDESRPAPKAA